MNILFHVREQLIGRLDRAIDYFLWGYVKAHVYTDQPDQHWNIFLAEMQELVLHDMWFQQGGATCHTARVTMDLLRGEFGEHFISRSGPVNCCPDHAI